MTTAAIRKAATPILNAYSAVGRPNSRVTAFGPSLISRRLLLWSKTSLAQQQILLGRSGGITATGNLRPTFANRRP